MPKVTGFNRKRIGHRNYVATISSPPTTEDEYGHVDHSGDWTVVIPEWPCELIDAAGGEVIDGFVVKATTEKVAIGDKPQVNGLVKRDHRVVIDGVTYGITAVRDVSGDNLTLRIELRSVS